MKNKRKHLQFWFISVFILAVFLEVFLWALCTVSPSIRTAINPPDFAALPDDVLGYRPNPDHPDHDKNGFRNSTVFDRAEVVAFGDSQTYGTGVASFETWPEKLKILSKLPIYNISYGGYCPVHSLALWEEGMQLNPAVVIEALYLGNDLFDAFNLVYNQSTLPALKTKDSLLQSKIQTLENDSPIKKQVVDLFKMSEGNKKNRPAFKRFLSKYSKIYVLLRQIKNLVIQKTRRYSETEEWEKEKNFANAYSKYCTVFESDDFKTIFTGSYRKIALDTNDVRIQEGWNIILRTIKKMSELSAKEGREFIVLGIPTKELVFRPILSELPENIKLTTDLEKGLWHTARSFFKENNITFVEGLAPLRQQLESGSQPYHQSRDGHINAIGHETIARALLPFLKLDEINGK